MAAVSPARLVVAGAAMALTACTLWAALEDPYKGEAPSGGDDGAAPLDAGADGAEAGAHVIATGFVPYALAAYGDSVFVVDGYGGVHVASDAGTRFAPFWVGDGGDVIGPTNRIAASAAGVFWTVYRGIRYCALDGGACGLLPHGGQPTLIAASDSVVAWTEGDAGIGRCNVPLSQCAPIAAQLGAPATSLAVGSDGTVAWATGGDFIGFVGGPRPRTILKVPDRPVDFVATDAVSGDLYWIGKDALGVVPLDGGTENTITPYLGGAPSQLFARAGTAYWTVPFPGAAPTAIDYCRFDVDGGCADYHGLFTAPGKRTAQGIVATSREVLTILAFVTGGNDPLLLAAPVPP